MFSHPYFIIPGLSVYILLNSFFELFDPSNEFLSELELNECFFFKLFLLNVELEQ